jgi:hypothetical protein
MGDRLQEPRRQNGRGVDKANKWAQAMLQARKGSLTWMDVGAEDLLAVVAHVTEDGAALLLAKTSDGGALMVQVLGNGPDKPKFYAASMAEVNELLTLLGSV